MSYVPSYGPIPARVMIVGEAPGGDEVSARKPFVGVSGQELDRMLLDAGIHRSECFTTNVCRYRPPNNDIEEFIPKRKMDITPDCVRFRGKMVKPVVVEGYNELIKEIDLVKPELIIACGNTPLWALLGHEGITKWRGSTLQYVSAAGVKSILVPIYHPAAILRQWAWRWITVHDLRRAKAALTAWGREVKSPDYQFVIRPQYKQVIDTLDTLQEASRMGGLKLAVDIETRGGHIACIGLAWNSFQAICIPLMCVEDRDGYWNETAEGEIIWRLKELLTNPRVEIIGQNFIYDAQYFAKHYGYVPNTKWDTMLMHHVMFPGTPKGLDYLSSLYCQFHVYWKDEGKEWDTSIPEEQYWTYNCKDAVITWECADTQQRSIPEMNLSGPAQSQMDLFEPVLHMMLRGVKIDLAQRSAFSKQLETEINERQKWMTDVLTHPINVRSPKQMQCLFYEDFQQSVIKSRKTKNATLDDKALDKIWLREPLLRPIIRRVREIRSLGVFKSTFVDAELDSDDRMRCSYNIAGTETFRFSSSANAFGSGTNLQNIPKGGAFDADADTLVLPNVRTLFVPDSGYIFWDADLDRADLQVVVWEADDKELKDALRRGVDLHILNGCLLFDRILPPLDELVETHPNYPEHKKRFARERQFAKIWVHGTNYGGTAQTMGANAGVTTHQSELLQRRWFALHPGILDWHKRTLLQLQTTRSVSNKFGYRRFYFDRIETILPEALAWTPQSTVAIVIDHGIKKLHRSALARTLDIQLLLQVHDSADGQFPEAHIEPACKHIKECLTTVIPYDDPLIIPVGIKLSKTSWGDCGNDKELQKAA